MAGESDERLGQIEAHLYSAINDGEMDDLAHEHVSRAYKLLGTDADDFDEEHTRDDVHGSFVARDLYPDYDELHQRVREHASERFDAAGLEIPSDGDAEAFDVDTSPGTWDIKYVCLEDGVVLYRVEHERLGLPEADSR